MQKGAIQLQSHNVWARTISNPPCGVPVASATLRTSFISIDMLFSQLVRARGGRAGAGAGSGARAVACSCGRGRSLCSSKRASLARVCALGAWWLLGRCLRIRAEGAWWRAAARGCRALCHARAAASCVAGSTERGVRMVRWDRRAPRADGNVAGQTGPLRELGRPARTRLRADVMRALC